MSRFKHGCFSLAGSTLALTMLVSCAAPGDKAVDTTPTTSTPTTSTPTTSTPTTSVVIVTTVDSVPISPTSSEIAPTTSPVNSVATTLEPLGAPPAQFQVTPVEDPFVCDGTSHNWGRLDGAAPGETIAFASPTVAGLLPGVADENGSLDLIWQCDLAEVRDSWTVVAIGSESNRTATFTVTGGQ